MTHICVGKSTAIGSDNALAPGRRQAIIWTKCCNIVNWTIVNKLWWNLNRNLYNSIFENGYEIAVWKLAAVLPRPQCVKMLTCCHSGIIYMSGNLVINRLRLPVDIRWQGSSWTSADLLSTESSGIHFGQFESRYNNFIFENTLENIAAQWWPFCSGPNFIQSPLPQTTWWRYSNW